MGSHVDFTQATDQATWYALVIEDGAGYKAFTDPIWVEPAATSAPAKRP